MEKSPDDVTKAHAYLELPSDQLQAVKDALAKYCTVWEFFLPGNRTPVESDRVAAKNTIEEPPEGY